ncbi:hypothetical protein [Flammeovirga sp. OC4]|uniref:hypothetical protein n=1 Tax=Flammeovirga sp. OC4 TaxID=1382345 RepID=UPI0012E0B418|nr:hypothetical protein [Flammeovirga sp. OC4]
MKTVFGIIAALIIVIATATTVMYTSALPGLDDEAVTITKANVGTAVSMQK